MQYDMIGTTSTRRNGGTVFLLFLIGLFSQTQISVGGKLGISEFAMVACAPFVFLKNITIFKRDGSLCYFWLIILWLLGALFVDFYTGNYIPFMMKGIAVPITVFANSVCIYVLLRRNFDNIKWLLLGIAISGVVSIFIFQRGTAGDLADTVGLDAGAERMMGYKLFWVIQLTTWLTLPISGWYLKISKVYSFFALLFLSVFNLASGGRSAFLIVAVSLLLVTFAGKTEQSLQFIKRHMFLLLILLCLVGIGAKKTYEFAATHGYMGDAEETKYERSTKQGSSALDLLMESRADFFIGLFAALDKPILGHGSVAIDYHGYVVDFASKHASQEAYDRILNIQKEFRARVIPAHSHIINFWMWHGIFGLVFWLYVIAMTSKTLFSRMHIYPPWFGYLAVTIPAFFWDVLFSPLGLRVNTATLFVVMLFVAKLNREQHRMPGR